MLLVHSSSSQAEEHHERILRAQAGKHHEYLMTVRWHNCVAKEDSETPLLKPPTQCLEYDLELPCVHVVPQEASRLASPVVHRDVPQGSAAQAPMQRNQPDSELDSSRKNAVPLGSAWASDARPKAIKHLS